MRRLLFLILFAWCFLSGLNGFSQGCFNSAPNLLSDSLPLPICSADFNGDGKPDLAMGNYDAYSISVFLGLGNGSFTGPTYFDLGGGMDPRGIVAADFNGDSLIDLATANLDTYNFSVLFGTGSGNFGPATTYSTGGGGPGFVARNISASDFNGDGLTDIVTVGDNYAVVIFLNLGGGAFGPPIYYLLASWTGPTDVFCADLNNDLVPDIVTANHESKNVAVLIGTGTGSFGSAAYYPTDSLCLAVLCADLNADGNKDIVTANPGAANVSVLLGTGAGNFAATTNYTVGAQPSGISVSDFDGDCNLDIAVTVLPKDVAILYGDGLGNFSSPSTFTVVGAPYEITKGDFNVDGKMDLAITNGSNTASVILNCSGSECGNGVSEESKGVLSIYPNPTTDVLNLKLHTSTNATHVQIENMMGQTVKTLSFSETIDVSDLPEGCYFIKVSEDGGAARIVRLIKQ